MQNNMLQICMPDSNTFKTSLSRGFYPVFEIKGAYFPDTREYPCSCPVQIHQLYIILQIIILSNI